MAHQRKAIGPTTVLTSSHYLPTRDAAQCAPDSFAARARSLLQQWPASAYNSTMQHRLAFDIRQLVLGPLKERLPLSTTILPWSAPVDPAHSFSNRGLRVIPDDADATPRKLLPSQVDHSLATHSLEDLVIYLHLYHAVGYEDGALLMQLLEEVHRFLTANLMTATTTSMPRGTHVLLPLPSLLYAMSRLGIVEERLLQLVVQHRDTRTGEPGLLYSQLPFYAMADHLQIIVALQRFGMQQDHAFERTVKALRHSTYSKQTPLGLFCKAMMHYERQRLVAKPSAQSVKSSSLTHSANGLTGEPLGLHSQLQALPDLPDGLRQASVELLIESLAALAASVHRRPDTVALVANVLAVTAFKSRSQEEVDRTGMVILGHQLLRAVKLCEVMQCEHTLLADVLGWTVTSAGSGVVVDGGEDAEVSSERRAYYDHVTADMVRLDSVQ